MTRKGKIARLPRHIRHKLNTRLENGELGAALVDWLNSLQDVRDLLARHFDSRPISEQNLSEWKQGGFLDWQRQQEACERVRGLVELSDELDDAAEQRTIPNRLAGVLAAELAAEVSRRLEQTTDPRERWQCICDALGQLNALRRADQTAARAEIQLERWQIECDQREAQETEDEIQAQKERAQAPVWDAIRRANLVTALGGGESAEKAADYLLQVDRIFSEIDPSGPLPPNQTNIKPDQAKSDQIKPNQT